jgi:phage tail sheath protein FI
MGSYTGGSLPSDERYAPSILNNEDASIGSALLSITDNLFNGTASERRPSNGVYSLVGGDDGLLGLVDDDFIGDEVGQTGLRAFDIDNTISILGIPGRATSAVHNAMLDYCENVRKGSIFPVLDPPAGLSEDQVIEYVTITASLKNASEYGGFNYPELKTANPDKTVFGNTKNIIIPPSGFIMGMFARTDHSEPGGVYKQPAGIVRGVLKGVTGIVNPRTKNEAVRDKLYPANINPIWTDTGIPVHVDGCANLKRTGNFQSIGERRGVIFIKRTLQVALLSAKHENNTPEARDLVKRAIFNFLVQQMKRGAFASKNPDEAFYVDMGSAVNPASEQIARNMNARIGLATARPAEFINLLLSQDQRAILEEIAALSV